MRSIGVKFLDPLTDLPVCFGTVGKTMREAAGRELPGWELLHYGKLLRMLLDHHLESRKWLLGSIKITEQDIDDFFYEWISSDEELKKVLIAVTTTYILWACETNND